MRDGAGSGAPAVLAAPVAGFTDTVAISGLTAPTAIRFAADGRVLVAEKRGRVLVYPSLGSTTPTVALDITNSVHDYWDRGLLGLALDPSFTTNGRIYVLYTYDHILGSTNPPPRWGDVCPSPPGPTTDGCVVSGRLSRFTLTSTVVTSGQVLVEGWCQQFPSHSVGNVAFGTDGFIYASAGDGASFTTADWGQLGGSSGSPTAANPCGDPPGGFGIANTSPSGRGGALRSQSLRRPAGEAVTLDGTIIRVDPETGAAAPGNPLFGSTNGNARRIVADGLRNPFRFTMRPGTGELWIGDVGWSTREEINRLVSPAAAPVENYGWPCYEGPSQQAGYAPLTMCQGLYTSGPVVVPHYSYNHGSAVVSGDNCPTSSGSSITGLAFYQGGSYPSKYADALFFADHTRNCIWAMLATNGVPDPTRLELFVGAAANPVDLQIGPGGDLFYVDHEGGTIHRVSYAGANTPPTATFTATPSSGVAPLDVVFDGGGSFDPDAGDAIAYAWDFTNNGTVDATTPTATHRYVDPGVYTARLTVTDSHGVSATTTRTIPANNTPPVATIAAPTSDVRWSVGSAISFSGSGTDAQDGTLPASALTWTLTLQHCTTPSTCHSHLVETRSGASSGTFNAPNHAYPSYLEVGLRAADADGATTTSTVRLDPNTVDLTFATSPNSLALVINGAGSSGTPATPVIRRTVIVNSQNSLSATTPQVLGGIEYGFTQWSDGSTESSRTILAPASEWSSPLTATFVANSADLSIAQSGVRSPTGNTVAWTVTVANAAAGLTASNLTVQISVSSRLGAPTFNATGWTCGYSASTRIATCTRPSLAPGTSAQIGYSTAMMHNPRTVTNTASVSSATRDVNTSNNQVTTTLQLR